MEIHATWRPFDGPANTPRSVLPETAFAFPHERAEPLTDAAHVRSAIARFSQVKDVTDDERASAFENLKAAAQYYGVAFHANDWHDIDHPHKRETIA
jgi:hypothetical protein